MKQFLFTVENCKGQTIRFRGDGENLIEAFKDGYKNAVEHGEKFAAFETASIIDQNELRKAAGYPEGVIVQLSDPLRYDSEPDFE